MNNTIASFCDCAGSHSATSIVGTHQPECMLGKRLKIKYNSKIQKVWSALGAEFTEDLIDDIMLEFNK